VLDQPILFEADDEVIVGAHKNAYPGLCFVTAPEGKTINNRLHVDLNPDDQTADVGQEDAPWVVIADPEGNELRVLQPHNSLID
jgi:hypothetical protein